jgi:MFS transporter, DHA2 family, multidrug resistance protein
VGLGSPATLALLVGSAVLLAAFTAFQLRHGQPLVDLRLFRIRAFAGCNVVVSCAQFAIVGLTVFKVMLEQNILATRRSPPAPCSSRRPSPSS